MKKYFNHSLQLKAAGIPFGIRVRMAKAMARGKRAMDALLEMGCSLVRTFHPSACSCCRMETHTTVRVTDPATGHTFMVVLVDGKVYVGYRAAAAVAAA